MFSFFRLIRIGNLAIMALALSLFYYIILVPAHHGKLFTSLLPFTTMEFVLFILSVVLVAAAGNIINDYFDFELDKEFKPERPLASGKISLDAAMYLHAALAFAGIGLGFYLGWKANNYKIGYLYVVSALLLYLYSAYLKKIPLAGNLVVSALTGFVFVLLLVFEAAFLNTIHFEGGNYVMQMLLWQVAFYGGFAVLTNLVRELVKDLEDVEGDASYNISTLPVEYGITVAKVVTGIAMSGVIGLIAYFQWLFFQGHAIKEIAYLAVAVQLPMAVALWLLIGAEDTKQFSRISTLIKVVMLLGILSMPVFYWFNKMAA